MVKNLPAMQEIQFRSLGWEDLLKKGMATHSSILAWRIPWTAEPGGLQSIVSEPDTAEQLTLSLCTNARFLFCYYTLVIQNVLTEEKWANSIWDLSVLFSNASHICHYFKRKYKKRNICITNLNIAYNLISNKSFSLREIKADYIIKF